MQLSEINIYPVKSLKGIPLMEAVVERRGLRHDRRWMLVDADGQFMTQREFPKMALIQTSVNGTGLTVRFDSRELKVPAEADRGSVEAVIFEKPVTAAMFGDDVNGWFSDVLDVDCRLVTMPETTRRRVDPEYALNPDEDVVSFADGYPFLLIGEGSLDDLNSRLEIPLPMNRFRPNFVVAGSGAYAEDSWKRIRIGESVFYVAKPCGRCVLPSVDQATGEKTGKEPLRTLSTYRIMNGKAMFGQNLIAEDPGGTVRVGDKVEVLSER